MDTNNNKPNEITVIFEQVVHGVGAPPSTVQLCRASFSARRGSRTAFVVRVGGEIVFTSALGTPGGFEPKGGREAAEAFRDGVLTGLRLAGVEPGDVRIDGEKG